MVEIVLMSAASHVSEIGYDLMIILIGRLGLLVVWSQLQVQKDC